MLISVEEIQNILQLFCHLANFGLMLILTGYSNECKLKIYNKPSRNKNLMHDDIFYKVFYHSSGNQKGYFFITSKSSSFGLDFPLRFETGMTREWTSPTSMM